MAETLPLNAPRDGSYVRALDGLRGIAILLVLIYHFAWTFPDDTPLLEFGKRALWLGWIGVDLFFALSGFLITQRLLASTHVPLGAALLRFWHRRALRIFPLYYLVLAVGSLAALQIGGVLAGPAFWLYLQNYTIPFVPFDVTQWTSHLWSLAVEEQFYLLWPPLLLGLRTNHRAPVALALALLTMAARAAFSLTHHALPASITLQLTYAALPFRADALLLGSLGALVVHADASPIVRGWRRAPVSLLWIGGPTLLALVLWTRGFNQYDRRVQIVGYAVLALVFSSLVVHAALGGFGARTRRCLESRPLVALGRVSYAAYLFHWPMVVLAIEPVRRLQNQLDLVSRCLVALALIPCGIALTWATSELSYRFFESPLLRRKQRLDAA